MTDAPPTAPRPRVVFLCTGNSARSILAEVLLRDLGLGRFEAASAGSKPTGRVHPVALATLAAHGHATDGLRSKSWEELAAPGAPPLDLVITVCASAAGETCPIWPGRPITAHWGEPDPAAVEGPSDAQEAAFEAVYQRMRARVERLLDLPAGLADAELSARVREIGAPSESGGAETGGGSG